MSTKTFSTYLTWKTKISLITSNLTVIQTTKMLQSASKTCLIEKSTTLETLLVNWWIPAIEWRMDLNFLTPSLLKLLASRSLWTPIRNFSTSLTCKTRISLITSNLTVIETTKMALSASETSPIKNWIIFMKSPVNWWISLIEWKTELSSLPTSLLKLLASRSLSMSTKTFSTYLTWKTKISLITSNLTVIQTTKMLQSASKTCLIEKSTTLETLLVNWWIPAIEWRMDLNFLTPSLLKLLASRSLWTPIRNFSTSLTCKTRISLITSNLTVIETTKMALSASETSPIKNWIIFMKSPVNWWISLIEWKTELSSLPTSLLKLLASRSLSMSTKIFSTYLTWKTKISLNTSNPNLTVIQRTKMLQSA